MQQQRGNPSIFTKLIWKLRHRSQFALVYLFVGLQTAILFVFAMFALFRRDNSPPVGVTYGADRCFRESCHKTFDYLYPHDKPCQLSEDALRALAVEQPGVFNSFTRFEEIRMGSDEDTGVPRIQYSSLALPELIDPVSGTSEIKLHNGDGNSLPQGYSNQTNVIAKLIGKRPDEYCFTETRCKRK
jgi:hypothetical protein